MTGDQPGRRRSLPSAADIEAELDCIAAINIEELRKMWRQRRGAHPPEALSKDLIGRALAHWVQEARLGGVGPHVRKLLASLAKKGPQPTRHLKIGSIIVREHQGRVHEVLVWPGGFCWQGQTYSSLSTIARAITGTSWNGPRFFGLRAAAETVRAAGRERSIENPPSVEAAEPKEKSKSRTAPARRTASAAAAAARGADRGGGL
jgi:Protein of unknown function (DUF2924)